MWPGSSPSVSTSAVGSSAGRTRTSADPEAPGHQRQAVVGLDDGDAHEARARLAVELPRADERAALLGQALGEAPTVAHVGPQVEATGRHRDLDPRPPRQGRGHQLEAPAVPVALDGDVLVVIE